MNQLHLKQRVRRTIVATLVMLLGVGAAWAQEETDPSHFDLVLHGSGLAPGAVDVALRTNPAIGEQWETINRTPIHCEETTVFPNVSKERYFGQDIRENYVAVKMKGSAEGQSAVRAMYAMPHVEGFTEEECRAIQELIATAPQTVRLHSWAHYVRPRPAVVSPDRPFIDHIEAPVRHKKPGVLEVEWLELLYAMQE